jgi:hypothetical protein
MMLGLSMYAIRAATLSFIVCLLAACASAPVTSSTGLPLQKVANPDCAALENQSDRPSECVEKLPLEAKISYCRTLAPDARRECYNKAFAGEPDVKADQRSRAK